MNPVNTKLLLIVLMFLLIENLLAQSKSFRIVGYIPNYRNVETFTKDFDFSRVTHLNYAFQNPDASGNLTSSSNGLSQLVEKAHLNNVKVLVSIGGGGAATGTAKDIFVNLIKTTQSRAAFIGKIVSYLKNYKLDGLDVDIEGPAINSDYGAFVRQLADSLRPKGLLLTAAVGWGAENIPNTVLPLFDYITLMAYDYTGNWDPSRPGQHSPYWYADKMIRDWLARGVKKENLCLGLPFYGYGFYKSLGSYSYEKILTTYPDAWKTDQVGDTIYYNGKSTIWKKTKLALGKTSGVMVWELSQDAKGENSLLKVIKQTVDSMAVMGFPIYAENQPIKIYPNPAQNHLIIEGLISENPIKIELYDIQGSLIKSYQFKQPDGRIRIKINSLNSGKYLCRITMAENLYSRMFVKE
ncbi:MAG: T9SS type A sorting domain-containing protein [Prolixibacteraceae bacterium]|nr:T9SS type A sorting domain-containing protein [Prolixibacteraceae bacterium]